LVSLKMNEVPDTEPEIVRLPRIGDCDHGHFDEDRLREVILTAIRETNARLGTAYGCEAIRYVENDSPDYRWYARGARDIIERLVEGGEWREGGKAPAGPEGAL